MDWRLILALGAVGVLTALTAWWLLRGVKPRSDEAANPELPQLWAIQPRACFSVSERRLYGWVKGAFPAHIVLIKVPLTRYMMPVQREEASYWYGLLGPLYSSFLVCEGSGRAVAAIDLADHQRGGLSRRALYIKRSALRACGVRYIALQTGAMPSLSRLRELVLGETGAQMMLADRPSEDMKRARQNLETMVRDRRADRQRSTFHDSTLDSRFDLSGGLGADSRFDPAPDSRFGSKPEGRLDSRFDSRFDSRLDDKLDSRLDALLDSRLGQQASKTGRSSGPDSRSPSSPPHVPRPQRPRSSPAPETTWTWPAPLDALPREDDLSGRGPSRPLDGDQLSNAIRELRIKQAGARALRLDRTGAPDSLSQLEGPDTESPSDGRVDIRL